MNDWRQRKKQEVKDKFTSLYKFPFTFLSRVVRIKMLRAFWEIEFSLTHQNTVCNGVSIARAVGRLRKLLTALVFQQHHCGRIGNICSVRQGRQDPVGWDAECSRVLSDTDSGYPCFARFLKLSILTPNTFRYDRIDAFCHPHSRQWPTFEIKTRIKI